MSEPNNIVPTGWRREFADQEIIPIKGFAFMLVRVTKRGLTFRKVNPKPHPPHEEQTN
jgi:hypothetical protein